MNLEFSRQIFRKSPDIKFYTFCTAHYGKRLKKSPTNAPVVYLFYLIYLHLHVSVVIRPLAGCLKLEYNELQCVYQSKIQFLKCVVQF